MAGLIILGSGSAPTAQADYRLPELGNAASAAMDPVEEQRLGQEILTEIRRSLPVIEDAQLTQYISELGNRLTTAAGVDDTPFTFLVVKSPEINAFATPGGIVVVYTGLIAAAESESELAGVLAHEISHVTQQHIARQYAEAGRQSVGAILGIVAAALLASYSPNAAQAGLAAGMAYTASDQLQFSRDNEQEADREGRVVLQKAGFDVNAMSSFFRKLQATQTTDPSLVNEFLQTHPLPSTRISDTWNPLDAASPGEVRESANFDYMRARVLAFSARNLRSDQQQQADSAELQAYVKASQQLHLRQGKEALQTLEPYAHSSHPWLTLLRAEAMMMTSDYAAAQSELSSIAAREPVNPAAVILLADSLMQQGKSADAAQLLERTAGSGEVWIPASRMLADAYSASGNTLASQTTLADYYEKRGNLRLALEQISLALADPKIDRVRKARLETREQQLREKMREHEKNKRLSN